jgi:hypothetical protein
MHWFRNAFMVLGVPLFTAAKHWLYVHRATPIQRWRVRRCAGVGYTRTRLTHMGGGGGLGFSGPFLAFLLGLRTAVRATFTRPLAFPGPPVGCCTASVMACHEEVCHSHEVVREFSAPTRCRSLVIVNQELAVAGGKDVLEEVDRKPAEAVTVGNHNFSDTLLKYGVQKPLEAAAVRIEA